MEINLELPLGREEKSDDDENVGNVIENEIEEVGNVMDLRALNDNKSVSNCYVPQIGLEFETKEAAYSFYREYARSVGFGITIKASRRSKKSGKFIDIKIVCSRYGRTRQASVTSGSRSCPKTDCRASMHIKRRADEKWFIHSFVEDHNHEICPDDFYNAIKGRNKRNDVAVHQKKGLQLVLDEKDVQILLDYLMLMQAESPGFYYLMDFSEEARMRNVFWVDPKGRRDYVSFGDVVFFDTYYIKSKFKIPLLPIVGVSHHFQFILLGCALIGDDTPSTYVWLMRSWLRAVGGQNPKVVITDNDKSLIEAAAEVFVDASHCFCPWHVLEEIGPNLNHKLSGVEAFLLKFKKCMYRSWTNEEFDTKWRKMVDKFDLGDDKWIQSLYELRGKWVPTYMRDNFLGGLCSDERSQSVASFFDKYLLKENTIEEFLHQYKLFLHDKCEEEAEAEDEAQHRQPTLISHSPFEEQMSKVYTHAMYKKFQAEVLGIVACNVEKVEEDEITIIFKVNDLEKKQMFTVAWNRREHDVCCLCRLFEYNGYLCRHALSVLQLSGILTIPSNYILKRWSRNAKISDTTHGASRNLQFRVQRFDDLCKLATKLGEEGSLSGEAYQVACHALEEALKHCAAMNYSFRSFPEPTVTAAEGLSGPGRKEGSSMVKGSKTKKSPKRRKVGVEVETASTGIQPSSRNVEQLNSRSLNIDDPYISHQHLQGMELGSRIPVINGYYGVQHIGQALGALNPLSSMPQYYHSDQSTMQGVSAILSAVSAHVSHAPHQTPQAVMQGGQFSFRASSVETTHHVRNSLHNAETSEDMTSKHLHD